MLGIRSHFPPAEAGMPAGSNCFAPCVTFAIYVAPLEKARDLLGLDLEWRAEAVSIARHGLSKADDRLGQ